MTKSKVDQIASEFVADKLSDRIGPGEIEEYYWEYAIDVDDENEYVEVARVVNEALERIEYQYRDEEELLD